MSMYENSDSDMDQEDGRFFNGLPETLIENLARSERTIKSKFLAKGIENEGFGLCFPASINTLVQTPSTPDIK